MKLALRLTSVNKMKKCWQLYIVILLPLAYLILFHYVPMYGIQLAFKDFNPIVGISNSPWIGFKNFEKFIKSYNFWTILYNTLAVSIYSLIAGFPVPIILAISLNECENDKFKRFVQTVTYAPHFISMVVLVSMIIQFLSLRNGMLNNIVDFLGGERVNFMAEAGMFRNIYVWSGIWQNAGYNSIIYLAALTSIEKTLYEAAEIDGASKLQKIWYIDIPGIIPTAVIMLILSCGSIMNVGVEKVYLLQNPLNLETSEIISTYVFKLGIERADFSFSTAIGFFNSFVNFILLITVNKIARTYGETSLW